MAKKTESVTDGPAVLRAALKSGEIARCYLFYGEETYLRSYYLEQLRAKLLSGPADAFNEHRFDGKTFSCESLSDAIEALPVMAERTVIQVDDLDFAKLNEADREQLTKILLDLPEYVCLIFVFDVVEYKLDRRQKSFADAVTRACTPLQFPKQSQANLMDWCTRHFRASGKHISGENCAYLLFLTDGTMTSLKPELEKITAYAVSDEITKADIDAVVIPVLDAQVFDITDALAARDFPKALVKLQTIFQMQEEPIPILAAIASNLRRVFCAKTLAEQGKGEKDLMQLCGMSDYPARKTMASARNFSMQWCQLAVCLCAETDYQLKTSYDDPYRLLELLLLRLAEEAEHA